MLKVYIVDDEPLARDELSYLLQRSKRAEVVGEADSVDRAFEQIQTLKPDVVFIDIQLAEGSGMDLAARVSKLDDRPAIVFATADDEYALKAFELNALDYILKPFDEYRVRQTVEKLTKPKSASAERPEKLAIAMDDRIVLIRIGKIIYISSAEGKTEIVTDDRRYLVNETLVSLELKLRNTSVVRVHRAFLANLDHVVEIQPWFHSTYHLIMKDGSKVPVSRTYIKELKQQFGF